jgi:hypothetical protein
VAPSKLKSPEGHNGLVPAVEWRDTTLLGSVMSLGEFGWKTWFNRCGRADLLQGIQKIVKIWSRILLEQRNIQEFR